MTAPASTTRARDVRRGQWLTWATIAYNSLEALVAIDAGLIAGSVALVGFGFDSVIELGSSVAGLWRLHADASPARRERAERQTLRIIGTCFLALAAWVLVDASRALLGWWWADPVAALAMVPLIAWEGLEAVRGRTTCADECG